MLQAPGTGSEKHRSAQQSAHTWSGWAPLKSKPHFRLWFGFLWFGFCNPRFMTDKFSASSFQRKKLTAAFWELLPVLEKGRVTPVPVTPSPSGADRNKVRDVWPGWRAESSPASTAVRDWPAAGVWAKPQQRQKHREKLLLTWLYSPQMFYLPPTLDQNTHGSDSWDGIIRWLMMFMIILKLINIIYLTFMSNKNW